MPYLPEEAALIDAMISAYFTSGHVSDSVRKGYEAVHRHLQENRLDRADYRRIFNAIDFLLPSLRTEPQDYRLLVSAMVKTTAVLAEQ